MIGGRFFPGMCMMVADPLIVAQGVGVDFGSRPVVRDVNLALARREFVAIVGRSGCGKTTLLRMIAGLLRPTVGELRLGGTDGRPRIAYVFQDPTLVPWRTALENVRLPLDLQRRPRQEATAAARQSLLRTGLTVADADKFPHTLSGGMRMRVSLSRALVTRPEVLLLDEPFAALDDLTRQQMHEELLGLCRDEGCTSILVTHNIAEALFLAQRVIVMSGRPGTIAAEVAVPFPPVRRAELRAQPEFARLVGEVGRHLEGAAV